MFRVPYSGIKSDYVYSIAPIDTQRLRETVLTPFKPVSFPLDALNRTMLYQFECNGHDPFIHAVCWLRLGNTANVKRVVLSINSTVLCDITNSNRLTSIPLAFLDDEKDCLLVDRGTLCYSSFRFAIEYFDEQEHSQVALTFVPLLINVQKIDMRNLIGFDYCSCLLNGQFLIFSSGIVAIQTERPGERQLCESIAVQPSEDASQKIVAIYSHNVGDIVSTIPEEYCVQRGRWVIDTYPPCMDVLIYAEHENDLRFFCLSKDATCRIDDRGARTFYTEEQQEEMLVLSRDATDVKHRYYQFLQGLCESPHRVR